MHGHPRLTWLAIGVLSTIFLLAGIPKVFGLDPGPANFERWGYPGWFLYVVGAGEVALAGLLWWRPASGPAAMLLGVNMLGAAATHLLAAEFAMIGINLALAGVAVFVVEQRWVTIHNARVWIQHPHLPHRHQP